MSDDGSDDTEQDNGAEQDTGAKAEVDVEPGDGSPLDYAMTQDNASVGLAVNDTLAEVSAGEVVIPPEMSPDTSEGDDIARGGATADVIEGFGGDDQINGYDGDDRLTGGAGSDELHGCKGNDLIFGGVPGLKSADTDGADLLNGGVGADSLMVETGDWANGGEEGDLFALGEWIDLASPATIVDFSSRADRIAVA